MVLSIYFLSLIFLILGWIYYYNPALIQRINDFFKEKIFNDRHILLKRKKIAVVFFVAACLLLTSGFIKSHEEKHLTNAQSAQKEIMLDAVSTYVKYLAQNPDNITVLVKLANAYNALGETNRELQTWNKILAIDPENEAAKKRLNAKF